MTKANKAMLDREFIKWFYEEQYPEMGSNRAQVHAMGGPGNVDVRDYWMRQAFKAGAYAMWDDINGALCDWACAVEGLEPELLEPCEVYDRARENLHSYVYNQLELFREP
ncbi:MAG: hypothetical protein ACO265_08435 [Polynucleobacter sp.]